MIQPEKARSINERYGKAFLVASSLVIWGMLIILFKTYGYEETWKLWRVLVEQPQFSDFRLIPGSAESFRRGFEPTLRNPGDPHKRLFNYPAFWRLFFYTGITQADTVWAVSLMLVLFFMGVFLFPQNLTILDSLILLLILFSPASMLLYERGNADLIVFFLCAVIVWLAEFSAVLTAGMLIFAIIVKIFPFFGLTVFLKESKPRFAWLSLACFTVLLVYLYSTFGSVKASWNLTMRGDEVSYGSNVLFLRYGQFFSDRLGVSQMDPVLKYGPIILAGVLILLAGMIGLRSADLSSSSPRNLSAFRMGAAIYVGTFLLGNNWDYRLAFLIFVMPQLLQWARQPDSTRDRVMTRIIIGLIFLSCWHFVAWYAPSLVRIKEILFVLDEIFNWSLVVGFSYLLSTSAPEWVKEQFLFLRPKKFPVQIA